MARQEVDLTAGTRVELISLRTKRRNTCEIQEVLGVGGTAKVYAGVLDDGSHVVLKAQRFEGELDPAFEVEVELFTKLFHRNIVHCVGVGSSPQKHLLIAFRRAYPNPLLLLSQANEDTLRDRKARYVNLPLDTAIDLAYELVNGLSYLEQLGFVHHDVKLANLMIDIAPQENPLEDAEVFDVVHKRTYRCVLIDFGATRSRSYLESWNKGEITDGLAPQITPYYAPPESVVETRLEDGRLGVQFHPSLDVYASSLVIYAMITGHSAYSHLRQPPDPQDFESLVAVKSAERRGEIEPVSLEVIRRTVFEDCRFVGGDRAGFDQGLYALLSKRLHPDPAKRGSAKDMKRDLEKLAKIRSDRGLASGGADLLTSGSRGSRVFLPFRQELVVVGRHGAHPLTRAARQCRPDASDSGALEPQPLQPQSARPLPPSPPDVAEEPVKPDVDLTSSTLDWLEDLGRGNARPFSKSLDEQAPGQTILPDAEGDDADPHAETQLGAPRARKAGGPEWLDDFESGDAESTRHGFDASELDRPPALNTRTPPPPRPERPNLERPQPERAGASSDRATRQSPPAHATQPARRARGDTGRLRRPGRRRPGAAEPQRPRPRRRPPPPVGRRPGGRRPPSPTHVPNDPYVRQPPPEGQSEQPHYLLSALLDAPVRLQRGDGCVIGRATQATIQIKSDLVSRKHAKVFHDGRAFVVCDLGSVNGTFLNDVRLDRRPAFLRDGDMIKVSGFEVVLRILSDSASAQSVPEVGSGTTRVMFESHTVLKDQTTFSGDLGQLGMKDVLEILEWKGHTGILSVMPLRGPRGQIHLRRGIVVHAELNSGERALPAAVALLRTDLGRFSFVKSAPPNQVTITGTHEELWAAVE